MEIKETINKELKLLVAFKESKRNWHIPLLAAICLGTPLLIGLYFDNLQNGLFACLSGMVILYLPTSGSLTNRMITILVSSFGFMVSFTIGLIFSFNPIVSALIFGLYSITIHWIVLYYKTSPPGSFFFILIAAMSSCQPFDLSAIPVKAGLIGLGTMYTCLLALIYTLVTTKNTSSTKITPVLKKNNYADFVEALIVGGFMAIALSLGHLLKFSNPYWIPISCAAVMQGASLHHIWQRTMQRITGTFIGLALCWGLLSLIDAPLSICITIIILQFIIEMLVVRQYALAVIFITPLTVLLAEAANPLIQDSNALIALRFWEITIGSILGTVGGWVLYKEKIRYASIRGVQKLHLGVKKKIK
ncbi:FUSC family protein [Limibacter armeniacum]|uniref:FUSC family protein n=1 Tax=Limibacter armeniacum TaxID=466084 RepID=UPI002FE54FF4